MPWYYEFGEGGDKNGKIPYTVLKLAMGSPTNFVYLVQETLSRIESLRKLWVKKYDDLKKKIKLNNNSY